LLAKYVESVRKFNKTYFAHKTEALRQQRRQEGNDIPSLIAKINENYMKNGSHLDQELNEEDYMQDEYEVEKRDETARSVTPYNYRNKRSTHNKTTAPGASSSMQRGYRENKLQTSNSRVPFQIFDQNARTPNYNDYEEADIEMTPDNQKAKINEFSLCYSENSDEIDESITPEKPTRMLASERLRKEPDAKAQLVEANAYNIVVKIVPPANEINVQNNIINIKTKDGKRRKKSKIYHAGQKTHRTKYEPVEHGYDSDSEMYTERHFRQQEKVKKRMKKHMYKRSKDALLDTPPTLYKLGNIDKRANKMEKYGIIGGYHPYEHQGAYYIIPSSRMGQNPYALYGYGGENASPMLVKFDKKYGKERLAPFYPSF
jgi:hypothetical protein